MPSTDEYDRNDFEARDVGVAVLVVNVRTNRAVARCDTVDQAESFMDTIARVHRERKRELMHSHDVTGQGDELREKLRKLSKKELATEFKYRLRRPPGKSLSKKTMIDRIVRYVDKTGDGPERLKDMLRF